MLRRIRVETLAALMAFGAFLAGPLHSRSDIEWECPPQSFDVEWSWYGGRFEASVAVAPQLTFSKRGARLAAEARAKGEVRVNRDPGGLHGVRWKISVARYTSIKEIRGVFRPEGGGSVELKLGASSVEVPGRLLQVSLEYEWEGNERTLVFPLEQCHSLPSERLTTPTARSAISTSARTSAVPLERNRRILIRGGQFQMGGQPEAGRVHENPPHWVRLSPFLIQEHPVTNEEYARFAKSHTYPEGHGRHPVTGVSWREARGYANWLGGDLPTEAQWEFAARGEQGRTYPWGDEAATCAHANFRGCGSEVIPVGMRPRGATPDGVQDMAGNVAEWCYDWYGDYPAELQTDPLGPQTGSYRVVRGGSFADHPLEIRSAERFPGNPENPDRFTGFRVAWSAVRPPG